MHPLTPQFETMMNHTQTLPDDNMFYNIQSSFFEKIILSKDMKSELFSHHMHLKKRDNETSCTILTTVKVEKYQQKTLKHEFSAKNCFFLNKNLENKDFGP